jgi:hypothetical protein
MIVAAVKRMMITLTALALQVRNQKSSNSAGDYQWD